MNDQQVESEAGSQDMEIIIGSPGDLLQYWFRSHFFCMISKIPPDPTDPITPEIIQVHRFDSSGSRLQTDTMWIYNVDQSIRIPVSFIFPDKNLARSWKCALISLEKQRAVIFSAETFRYLMLNSFGNEKIQDLKGIGNAQLNPHLLLSDHFMGNMLDEIITLHQIPPFELELWDERNSNFENSPAQVSARTGEAFRSLPPRLLELYHDFRKTTSSLQKSFISNPFWIYQTPLHHPKESNLFHIPLVLEQTGSVPCENIANSSYVNENLAKTDFNCITSIPSFIESEPNDESSEFLHAFFQHELGFPVMCKEYTEGVRVFQQSPKIGDKSLHFFLIRELNSQNSMNLGLLALSLLVLPHSHSLTFYTMDFESKCIYEENYGYFRGLIQAFLEENNSNIRFNLSMCCEIRQKQIPLDLWVCSREINSIIQGYFQGKAHIFALQKVYHQNRNGSFQNLYPTRRAFRLYQETLLKAFFEIPKSTGMVKGDIDALEGAEGNEEFDNFIRI